MNKLSEEKESHGKEKARESTKARAKGKVSKVRVTTAVSLDARRENAPKEREESGVAKGE